MVFQTAVEGRGDVAAGLSDGVTALAWLQQVTRDLAPAAVASSPATVYPLTVIASTPTGYAALRTTVAHLRRQTVADQIELALVAAIGTFKDVTLGSDSYWYEQEAGIHRYIVECQCLEAA